MGMNDGFFKDYGFGNYYQGTSQNTSGQTYNPANYGGRGVFNPSDPNNVNNINPTSFRSKNPLGLMAGPVQMPNGNFSLSSLYNPNWGNQGITLARHSDEEPPLKYPTRTHYPWDNGTTVQPDFALRSSDYTPPTVRYPLISAATGGSNDQFSSDWWNGLYKQLGWM